jgi:hypothetical protein
MAYSDIELSALLSGYWDLVEGNFPPEFTKGSGYIARGGFECASECKQDLDEAIDMLAPGRWSSLVKRYYPFTHFVFEDHPKELNRLSFRQQAIVRYHLLNQEYEKQNAMQSRLIMLRFLNGKKVRIPGARLQQLHKGFTG